MDAPKFTFDTEFRADGDVISQAARARKKQTMTTEEIENLLANAHAEGTKVESVRAAQTTAQAIVELSDRITAALEASHNEIETIRAEAATIAIAAARKIAHVALAALPTGDVEAALREAMHQAIGEPRITLRASAEVIAALEARINDIAHEEGYEGRVMIAADATVKGADCRIEWRGGGSERSEAAIAAALDALIERRFSNLVALKG